LSLLPRANSRFNFPEEECGDYQNCAKRVNAFLHYIFVIWPNARLAKSLPKIEMDFEKEIARIMPRTALRRTEKSSVIS
jgi:hypothetical protein